MKPIRVLFVSGGSLDYGGIASWMLSYASRFDRDAVAVDFLVHGMEQGAREGEAAALGAKVYHVPLRRNDPLRNRRGMAEAIGAGYDIVHAHMEGMNALPLSLAKRCGVRVRISHAHSVDYLTDSMLHRMVNAVARMRIPDYATALFACSDAAGIFLYGEESVSGGSVKIIRNAIELEDYQFDVLTRDRIRKELNFEDRFIIGSVGHLNDKVKNQSLLFRALRMAKRDRPELALVLAGDGPDMDEFITLIKRSGLEGDVILTGQRGDIPALLSAFDLFALPSWFEGLGIALVEAQASGLNCLASDRIPNDTQIVSCEALPPDRPDLWAARFLTAKETDDRVLGKEAFVSRGYEIEAAARELANAYREMAAE